MPRVASFDIKCSICGRLMFKSSTLPKLPPICGLTCREEAKRLVDLMRRTKATRKGGA